jgi:Na+/melibiose symporter-like transporter
VIDFPQGLPVREIHPDKIFALGVIDGPFAMVWGLVAAVIYAGYKVDSHRHADIQRQLVEARRVFTADVIIAKG